MINKNSRIYKPLAPKPLAPRPLAPRSLAPTPLATGPLVPRPLMPRPLATSPLAPRPLMPGSLAASPLAPRPLTLLQNQNFSDKMGVNSNVFMEYRTDTLMIPGVDKELDYSLQENNQEIYIHEKNIPIDILNVKGKSFSAEDLTNTKENAKGQGGKKRKITESQIPERWSDEETDKLLSYLEDNYEKFQQGKKAAVYKAISTEIIKTKTSESIKGRIVRLLEKYEKVKKQNDKTGSERIDWKWFDQMDRIFGCHENINPSFISNNSTGYISDEVEVKTEKITKKKKNNVESLVDIMNNIIQSKHKISEQKLELERKKVDSEFQLQREKMEMEKQEWEYKRDQSRMLHELAIKKIELQLSQQR